MKVRSLWRPSRPARAGWMRHPREGAATVELAVCAPLLVVLALGSIETCSMIFLDQTLHLACYEGVRVAIQKDATNAEVIARCNAILGPRAVNSASVVLDPPDVSGVTRGEWVTVTVSAPADSNNVVPWIFRGRTLAARCVMAKE